MRRALILLVALGLGLAAPARALAWHSAGHMAIARIAYQELDDKEKKRIAQILKAHPHYKIFLAAERPEGASEHEWAFLRAAVWPDWVRPPSKKNGPDPEAEERARKYHRGPWHYINLAFVPPGDRTSVPAELPARDYDADGEPGHILTALKKSMTILRARDMPDEVKAVYLCWLLHLLGDLHQPLHCSTLVSRQFPRGDQGGNLFLVSLKEGGPAVVLHAFWDGLLFRDAATFADIKARVDELRGSADLQRDKLPELELTGFASWAEESFGKARTVGYLGGKLQGARRPARGEAPAEAKAPVVPEGYEKAAAAVARRRMVLAGYRLADQLRAALRKR
jgi:hypothetical protein